MLLLALQGNDKREREWAESMIQTIIAQRAYDLAQHAVGYSLEYLHECGVSISSDMGKRIQPSIPDLTEWSKYGFAHPVEPGSRRAALAELTHIAEDEGEYD
jgi:hypothetical protein